MALVCYKTRDIRKPEIAGPILSFAAGLYNMAKNLTSPPFTLNFPDTNQVKMIHFILLVFFLYTFSTSFAL
jgi:hypothetical protein